MDFPFHENQHHVPILNCRKKTGLPQFLLKSRKKKFCVLPDLSDFEIFHLKFNIAWLFMKIYYLKNKLF